MLLSTVLHFSSTESLRPGSSHCFGKLVPQEVTLENLLLRNSPISHQGTPSADHSVPVQVTEGREELKDSLGFLLFPGWERESYRSPPRRQGARCHIFSVLLPSGRKYSGVGTWLGHSPVSRLLALEIGCSAWHHTYSMFTPVQAQRWPSGLLLASTARVLVLVPSPSGVHAEH